MEANFLATLPPVGIAPHFPASYQRGAQRIALPYLNRTIFISVDDVLFLQGEGNYTFLYTRDRKRYLVSKTLRDFEKILDDSQFLRIHKSYMINLAYVQQSLYGKDRVVRLADGREIAISRRRLKVIAGQLAQYWQRFTN